MGRKIVDFLIDTRATYSVVNSPLTESLWQAVTVTGISVSPESQFFLKPLECAVEDTVLTHRFLYILECPITLLEGTCCPNFMLKSLSLQKNDSST